jgi:hypothetical protein
MDWPVIGAVVAVVIVGGGVAFEAVTFFRSDSPPAKPATLLANYGSSVDRSAYDIPGFASSGAGGPQLSFPLIRLIDPDRSPEPDRTLPAGNATPQAAKKADPAAQRDRMAPPNTNEVKVAKLTPTESEPASLLGIARTGQWRVVATANASYFNLGGHIDKAGVVDGLASPHLRDALRQHSKFGQLPPDIKTHILTQNIDLTKVAPYRTLLGMDDSILEQEQAIKFVRVH